MEGRDEKALPSSRAKPEPITKNDMPSARIPARAFNGIFCRCGRASTILAVGFALVFVAAINDARAQDSSTNTNEFLVDPYFVSFGSGLFGGSGGIAIGDGGGTFSSQAATGTYTTNTTQAWSSSSGLRTPSGAGWTISQYSFGTDTTSGQVNGGYFSTGTTIGSGTAEALRVGQVFLIRMGGEDDSGRTGIQSGGRIGFSLGTGTDIFNGGTGLARATNDGLVRVEFVGGASSASFSAGSTVTTSMPGFPDFKSGQYYAVEVLSDKEFILRYGTSSNANTVVYNMQSFAGSGGSIGKVTLYNLGQNMASLYSNIVVSNTPYLNFSNNTGENNTIAGVISDNGATANAAVKNGVGTVLFSGNNTYTGATTISNGTLGVTVNNALGTAANGTTIASGTTLDFQNINYSTTEGVTNNGGTIATTTGTSTFAGGATLGANSTYSVGGTQLTQSGVITDGANSYSITKSGAGILVLSADNTYDGGTVINAGTVSIAKDLALGNAPGSASAANISFGGGTLAITTGFTMSSNRGITLNSGGGTINISASQNLSYGGVITGANTITKAGTGTLTLSGANTYSGATQITAGTVTVNSGGNLGNGNSDVTISSGATLNVNASLTVDSVKETGSGNGGVIAIGSSATLTIDGANKGTLYQNSISGAGNLTVAASGTTSLSLYGTQSYTGSTAVSGGKLSTGVALSSTAFSLTGGTFETSAANLVSDTASFTLGGGTFSIGGTETFGNNGVALTASTTSTVSPTNGVTATVTGALSGSGNLTKGDAGTLILSGNSTGFSGNTTVNAGTLVAANDGALGASGSVSVLTGARLQLSNNITVSRNLVLNSDGISTSGSLQNVSGNNTWSGGISNNSAARINSDTGTLTLSGNITNAASQTLYVGGAGDTTISGTVTGATTSGNGALLKNDGGTLTLSANNSALTGLIRLQGGTISITNANSLGSGTLELGSGATTSTLLVNSNTTRTSVLAIADSSTAGVIQVASGQTYTQSGNLIQTNGTANTTKVGKSGAGALVLSGTGSTYGGQFQIGDGSVIVAANNSLSTNTTTANRGVDLGLNVGEVSQGNNVSLLGRNGVTISNSIYVAPNTSSALRTIGLDGSGSTTFNNEIYLDGTLTVDPGTSGNNVTISGVLATNYLGAGGGVTKVNAGTLTLSGNNTFSGTLTVSDGKLTIASINNASAIGVLGQSANAVVLGGSGTTGFLHYTGATASSDKKFTAAAGGVAGIEVSNSATKLTLSGLIDGSGGVQKGGAGTLTLSGNNTFSGALNVHNGTLEVASINNASANGVLGNSANAVGLGKSGTANTATLLYTGATASSTKTFSLNSETNAASVINVSGSTAALTLSGEITGVGKLEKAGAGTLILSSSNNYSGGLLLSAGVIQFNSAHAGGTGRISQSSGSSTIQFSSTGTVTNEMSIYNVRSTTNVTLSGAKTLNNATYTIDANTVTTDSGNLSGSGGVTKQGAGTLILTGNNTYTGAVAVNAGLLDLNSSAGGAAATTSSVSVATGATLLVSTSDQVSNTAAVTLSGGTIKRASGVSEVFGNLNITAASFLDFGSGVAGNVQFQTYGNTGSALVTVQNFFQGNTLQFASASFNSSNLSQFTFDNSYTTSIQGSYFTITAIPEPSTYLAAGGLIAMLLWPSRRRLIKDTKSILGLRAPARDRLARH